MRVRSPIGPALLVIVAAISQEVGAAFAVGLFTEVGALGAVFVRFLVAGVVLCAVVRPRVRGLARRAWVSVVWLAASLAVMNACFYVSLTRTPLGVAVTIEALGPLILSVIVSPRRSAWLWAVLAFAGVVLLGLTGLDVGHLDPIGVAFAAAARCRLGRLHSGHGTGGRRLRQPRRARARDRHRCTGAHPGRDRDGRTGRRVAVGCDRSRGRRGRAVLGDPLLVGTDVAAPPTARDVRGADLPVTGGGRAGGVGGARPTPYSDRLFRDRAGNRGQHRRRALG